MVAGMIAFFVAPAAMLVKKGGDWHRRWGKVYVWSMVVVVISVFTASFFKPNPLLMLIGIFSIYMILSGYRALYLKRLSQGQRPSRADILLHSIAVIVNFSLVIWGGLSIYHEGTGGFGTVVFVIGAIGSILVFNNIRKFFKRRIHKQDWWFSHMGGMIGGYIATVSAFSAVNFSFIPDEYMWLRWLWPSIIGVPLIFVWVAYYRKKFAGGKSPRRYAKIKIDQAGST